MSKSTNNQQESNSAVTSTLSQQRLIALKAENNMLQQEKHRLKEENTLQQEQIKQYTHQMEYLAMENERLTKSSLRLQKDFAEIHSSKRSSRGASPSYNIQANPSEMTLLSEELTLKIKEIAILHQNIETLQTSSNETINHLRTLQSQTEQELITYKEEMDNRQSQRDVQLHSLRKIRNELENELSLVSSQSNANEAALKKDFEQKMSTMREEFEFDIENVKRTYEEEVEYCKEESSRCEALQGEINDLKGQLLQQEKKWQESKSNRFSASSITSSVTEKLSSFSQLGQSSLKVPPRLDTNERKKSARINLLLNETASLVHCYLDHYKMRVGCLLEMSKKSDLSAANIQLHHSLEECSKSTAKPELKDWSQASVVEVTIKFIQYFGSILPFQISSLAEECEEAPNDLKINLRSFMDTISQLYEKFQILENVLNDDTSIQTKAIDHEDITMIWIKSKLQKPALNSLDEKLANIVANTVNNLKIFQSCCTLHKASQTDFSIITENQSLAEIALKNIEAHDEKKEELDSKVGVIKGEIQQQDSTIQTEYHGQDEEVQCTLLISSNEIIDSKPLSPKKELNDASANDVNGSQYLSAVPSKATSDLDFTSLEQTNPIDLNKEFADKVTQTSMKNTSLLEQKMHDLTARVQKADSKAVQFYRAWQITNEQNNKD